MLLLKLIHVYKGGPRVISRVNIDCAIWSGIASCGQNFRIFDHLIVEEWNKATNLLPMMNGAYAFSVH